jgi:hypothetical protein
MTFELQAGIIGNILHSTVMCKGSIKGTVALVTGGNGDFVVPF